MAIDFNKWNQEYGGAEALEALKKAQESNGDYPELPEGKYLCEMEKLELGESSSHKPMIKGQFRIIEGKHKKQCIFYNQVFCRSATGNAFSIKKGLDFLRSLKIFEDTEVDFDGNYENFNDLLLDMAEESEGMNFEISKTKDGDYDRIEVTNVYA